MESPDPIKGLLDTKGYVVLDGALATELESRGCDISDSLWSCKALMESPELIRQVHYDYYVAGADIAITSSYQASPLGLAEQRNISESDAKILIKKSVQLAQEARQQASRTLKKAETSMLVAGSVGPYGAYLADGSEYRGDYGSTVSREVLKAFHRPRISALLAAGADCLACETIPSFPEVEALSQLLSDEFPSAWAWFSFTVRDSLHLSDGTPLDKVCQTLGLNKKVMAVGINCVARDETTDLLNVLHDYWRGPLLAYPNSGELWDAKARKWTEANKTPSISGEPNGSLVTCVREWVRAGAKIVGGCCRTGPEDVRTIAQTLISMKEVGSDESALT
ncbi:hypothetical protein FH972_023614 [Carpinus fangiana]|uniref:Hcy-binding domain-containing protein n=1 Tax=Carpinus fangiana TaxID=176857 RepID=A0A5N6KXY5_9ROSI|nr:hypothetical protein FH972_023614 [Carpinus fangiana]